jgi:Fatty acid hydroxylase superfamily
MSSGGEIRAAACAQGLARKRRNHLAALLSGSALALLSRKLFPFTFGEFSIGLLVGLFYANGFEYAFHRMVLHWHRGFFAQQHLRHHSTWRAPDEARYVSFARTPWAVVTLFMGNAIPVGLAEWVFRVGWASGMFVTFTLYYIAFEEIHWRTHASGWLPPWLRFAARHHLLHHAGAEERFNVFLPVFDWLFGTGKGSQSKCA